MIASSLVSSSAKQYLNGSGSYSMIQYGEVHEIIQIKNLIWLRYFTTTEEKLTWRRSLIHWKFEVATYIISSMFLDDIQNGSTSCWNNGLVVWSSKEAFLKITQKQWTTKSRLPIRSTWKEIFFTKRNSSLEMDTLNINPNIWEKSNFLFNYVGLKIPAIECLFLIIFLKICTSLDLVWCKDPSPPTILI